jgi:hypothetical protein
LYILVYNDSKFPFGFGGLILVVYFWLNKLKFSMEVKRVSDTMITVDNVIFEYNDRTFTYKAITAGCTHGHIQSLNHFLATENPLAEEEYCDYLKFVRMMNATLKEKGICLER